MEMMSLSIVETEDYMKFLYFLYCKSVAETSSSELRFLAHDSASQKHEVPKKRFSTTVDMKQARAHNL